MLDSMEKSERRSINDIDEIPGAAESSEVAMTIRHGQESQCNDECEVSTDWRFVM